MKLINPRYPLPEELEHAYPAEEAWQLVQDSLRQGRDIPGLKALRSEHTAIFDTDIVSRVKNGQWLLVKDEAYYFDWGQFDKAATEKVFEHKVMALMQAPPAVKKAEGRYFCAVDSKILEPLTYRNFSASENSQTFRAVTDYRGVASIAVMSISGLTLTN